MSYQEKYLKYKKKYTELKNQLGGAIPSNDICNKIHLFLKNLLVLSRQSPINYESLNKLFEEYNILELMKVHVQIKFLIGTMIYLLNINVSQIQNVEIKQIIEDVYKNRLYDVPESDYKDFTSDTFLNQMAVWYRPYFAEDYWNTDLKTFMDEYYRFKQTKQSYLLYWASLVNISLLFARITKCPFYMQTWNDKSTFDKETGKAWIPTPQNKGTFTFNKRTKSYHRKDFYSPEFNTLLRLYEIELWEKIKDKLIVLLICSFDCKYENIYCLYRKFMCFLHNNNNNYDDITSLPNHLKFICSNFGPEKDTIFYEYEQTLDNFKRKNNIEDKDIEEHEINLFEQEYIYLSLIFPSTEKFARQEFTNFVTSTVNPVYIVDNTSLDMINIVGHDLRNHSLMKRKKHFVDLPEIKEFVNLLVDEKKEKFLAYIHGLYHERRSLLPFSYKSLKLRLEQVSDREAKIMNEELTDEIIRDFKEFVRSKHIV
jgi:hypothetical protein